MLDSSKKDLSLVEVQAQHGALGQVWGALDLVVANVRS